MRKSCYCFPLFQNERSCYMETIGNQILFGHKGLAGKCTEKDKMKVLKSSEIDGMSFFHATQET